jgi:hypothetical protein
MSTDLYRALIDEICVKCDIRDPESLYRSATNLHVNHTDFSLYYGGAIDPFSALLYCDFGALPQDCPLTVPLRLLETNMYMFGVNSPVFTYNPDNGHVLLMSRIPLTSASADHVLEILSGLSDMVLGWRKDFYLDDAERDAGSAGALGVKRAAVRGTAERLARRLSQPSSAVDSKKQRGH